MALEDDFDILPEIIYKYKSFDQDGHGLNLAVNGQVYFPSPRDTNDPFENYFIPDSIVKDMDDHELDEYAYKKTLQNYSINDIKPFLEAKARAIKNMKEYKRNFASKSKELQELSHDKFGILSLTTDNRSIPMWAYYADSHKGICIGLKKEALICMRDQFFLNEKKLIVSEVVNYQESIPVINIDVPLEGKMDPALLKEQEIAHYTKSIHWLHEKEIRLISFGFNNFGIDLGHDAVSEIIIGMKACEKNINELFDRLTEVNSKAKVLRARISDSNYGIEIDLFN